MLPISKILARMRQYKVLNSVPSILLVILLIAYVSFYYYYNSLLLHLVSSESSLLIPLSVQAFAFIMNSCSSCSSLRRVEYPPIFPRWCWSVLPSSNLYQSISKVTTPCLPCFALFEFTSSFSKHLSELIPEKLMEGK